MFPKVAGQFGKVYYVATSVGIPPYPIDEKITRPNGLTLTIDGRFLLGRLQNEGAAFGVVLGDYPAGFARQIRDLPDIDDARLLELLEAAKRELDVRRPLRLVQSTEEGPAIMGLFRPVLILPR